MFMFSYMLEYTQIACKVYPNCHIKVFICTLSLGPRRYPARDSPKTLVTKMYLTTPKYSLEAVFRWCL